MAKRAWSSVSSATIKNCWNHTKIQCPQLPTIRLRPPMPSNLTAGWDIIVQYATEPWSLPEVHSMLQEHLGDRYVASEWNELLDSVLRAEHDAGAALAALDALCNKWAQGPDTPSNLSKAALPDEQSKIEQDLLKLVNQLKEQRCITGQPPTLDELLDPIEEWEIKQNLDIIELEDLEIVQLVQQEAGLLARGDIEEIESDSSGDDPEVMLPSLKEMIKGCRMFEDKSLLVCAEGAFEMMQAAHRY